jgi:hypothetical protein
MDNSGPAFPKSGTDINGMSLRDYFAAKAMQGMLSDMDTRFSLSQSAIDNKIAFAVEVSIQAYCHADAMLAEREKGKNG